MTECGKRSIGRRPGQIVMPWANAHSTDKPWGLRLELSSGGGLEISEVDRSGGYPTTDRAGVSSDEVF